MRTLLLLYGAILFRIGAQAQALNNIVLTNVLDNKDIKIAELVAKKPVVVLFFSNKCAYGDYYLDRIKRLYAEFSAQDLHFLLINSNDDGLVIEESPAAMQAYAQRNDIGMPYLADKEGLLKNYLKATRTPEVFLLATTNGAVSVLYRGAIDDSPQSVGDVHHQYLKDAIVSLLENKKQPLTQTRPVGCLIR